MTARTVCPSVLRNDQFLVRYTPCLAFSLLCPYAFYFFFLLCFEILSSLNTDIIDRYSLLFSSFYFIAWFRRTTTPTTYKLISWRSRRVSGEAPALLLASLSYYTVSTECRKPESWWPSIPELLPPPPPRARVALAVAVVAAVTAVDAESGQDPTKEWWCKARGSCLLAIPETHSS